ncbi:hypothetical protein Hypma_008370 [Hypsizygus marmoreus]|uniref:Uncharacterized protein n=1 Tax=Hypsizygus marmoreus TaxID=39966 RepID=A0A369K0A1_HYPMA|nr:hypothetical protein Hypma_008370 [Hypsizygus marmoreus]
MLTFCRRSLVALKGFHLFTSSYRQSSHAQHGRGCHFPSIGSDIAPTLARIALLRPFLNICLSMHAMADRLAFHFHREELLHCSSIHPLNQKFTEAVLLIAKSKSFGVFLFD